MDSELSDRHLRYSNISNSLSSAGKLYEKAAKAMVNGELETSYYHYIKEANSLVEDAFPEKFTPPPRVVHASSPSPAFDWMGLFKLLVPLLCVIFVLLYLIFSGTTGNVTQLWNIEAIKKNSAYPQPLTTQPQMTPSDAPKE